MIGKRAAPRTDERVSDIKCGGFRELKPLASCCLGENGGYRPFLDEFRAFCDYYIR